MRRVCLLAFICLWATSAFAQTGTISGKVVDRETGETLIGVNILVQGSDIGASSDVDGEYRLSDLEPGSYTLVFSYIGYTKKTVTGVEVDASATSTINVQLAPESVEMEEVTVEARAIPNSEAILLKDRQKAGAMSNAISAEAMSLSGAGTASEAMKKVTGASVLDGKYVHIRGLGDRYINTQLNGAPLPSADPNANSVPLDLFPSGLLDNIVTKKTFTPDQPGDFTGGSVNIGTKSYPESFMLSLSTSVSHNTEVGLGDEFLSYRGGGAGALGMNGRTHEMPDAVKNRTVDIPTISEARRTRASAERLDRISKSFDGVMAPSMRDAPMSSSYKFASGGQTSFLGRQLGLVGSLNYSRSVSGYGGGRMARWILPGNVSKTDSLSPNYQLSDHSGTDEVLWGGMASLNYKLLPGHTLSFNYMRNHSATSEARFLSGALPRDLTAPGATYQTRTLHYTERDIESYQVKGRHGLGDRGVTLEWNSTLAETRQDEPDLRYFSSNYTPFNYGGVQDTVFVIRPSIYSLPARYFRDLTERNWTSQGSVTVPFRSWNGLRSSLKFGGSYAKKTREFRERQFEYRQDKINFNQVGGDTDAFWNDQHLGILEEDSREGFWRFGNYVSEQSSLGDSYDGDQEIYAGFAMANLQLMQGLRMVTGVRYEGTDMRTASLDTTKEVGHLETDDWLPSLNLVYSVRQDMNLRAAYGRTLARPTFREMAPYSSFEFVNDFIFTGNPDLKRTLVNNYDLRWEWFTRPGEIVAVSGFYKDFKNPIERVILNTNGEIEYQNVSEAQVWGLELEMSKELGQIHSALQHLNVGANLTLTHSQTSIAPSELEIIRAFDPDADATRPMQGESPYVINFDLSYANPNTGTDFGAYYHVFGERQISVSLGGTPDLHEQPRHQVDLNFSQDLWSGFSLSASVSNLLGEPYRAVHRYKGVDYVGEGYPRGRSFSVGLSYEI